MPFSESGMISVGYLVINHWMQTLRSISHDLIQLELVVDNAHMQYNSYIRSLSFVTFQGVTPRTSNTTSRLMESSCLGLRLFVRIALSLFLVHVSCKLIILSLVKTTFNFVYVCIYYIRIYIIYLVKYIDWLF